MTEGIAIEWAVRESTYPGEATSGDGAVVRQGGGGVLAVALDGLGHGEGAHAASQTVVDALSEVTLPPESLERVFQIAHDAGRGGRGAAMSAAWFDLERATMTWAGVGNVDGAWFRSSGGRLQSERLPQQGGIVGYRMPRNVRERELPVEGGDVVVFATDGVSEEFVRHPLLELHDVSARRIASMLHEDFARGDDDALVLVVRCRAAE